MPDDLTITIDSKSFSGWQSVRVSRGVEQVPSSFDIAATERYPNEVTEVAIAPFKPCQVKIGADLVLTGYVDRVIPSISAQQHSVRIQGRSKLEDPVDCAVTPDAVQGMQITATNLVALASEICKPFGISVKSLTGDDVPVSMIGGGPLNFNVVLSETGYEVIERVARYAQVLVYDGTDGNMILARAGASSMASGFVQGVNVQSASCAFSGDQRFSVYEPMLMSYKYFGDAGFALQPLLAPVMDPGVPRFRPTVVISEQFGSQGSMAELRAKWEMARRYGRAQSVRLACDSWRDAAGTLWAPNAFAPVSIPSLKLTPSEPWVITQVTYSRDTARGTLATLELMPKEALMQEPTLLLPFLGYWPGMGGASGAASGP